MPDRNAKFTARLGIGTVQFGLDYAISGTELRPDLGEVSNILNLAASAGVRLLDTATGYGDSERVLGRVLEKKSDFRIVTKTASFASNVITAVDAETLIATFEESLAALNARSVYGLMVHNADNLLAEGGEYLYAAMEQLKQQGQVEKIGVSVYTSEQIESLSERYALELVQAPVSILDQRLIAGGQLKALKQAGVEIHARSIFLKGLIFAEPAALPNHFESARATLQRFREETVSHGLTPRSAALSFVLAKEYIDTVLCGVTSANQLAEILDDIRSISDTSLWETERYALTYPRHLNPALWPPFRITGS